MTEFFILSRFEHLDLQTEKSLAFEPKTEEEKEQRRVAEEKKAEYKRSLNQWKKQRKNAEDEAIREEIEKERPEKAEKRAALEKKRAEAKKIAEEKKEEKRIAEEKRKAEERRRADEACVRLVALPGELQVSILILPFSCIYISKVHIIHHLPLKMLQNLELPSHLLRLVLQVRKFKKINKIKITAS